MEELSAYPLCWPVGWKRTPTSKITSARFSKGETQHGTGESWTRRRELTIADGVKRVRGELKRLGVRDQEGIILSSNVQVKRDGSPYSDRREPQDSGMAVYWHLPGKQTKCMAINRYDRVADNLGAVAATIAAMRAIERHGGGEILDRVFMGFTALPGPGVKPWWQVMGFKNGDDLNRSEVESKYRQLAKEFHPDTGGDSSRFQELQGAIQQARKELI